MTFDALLCALGTGDRRARRGWSPTSTPTIRASRGLAATATTSTCGAPDGDGVLVVGRGICGRWEIGFEVAPDARGHGLGRRLVAAARGLVPAGVPLWAQVAPGNAASLRAVLGGGFVPVGGRSAVPAPSKARG